MVKLLREKYGMQSVKGKKQIAAGLDYSNWHNYSEACLMTPGGRLNKKDGLTRYGDSHVKDKTS